MGGGKPKAGLTNYSDLRSRTVAFNKGPALLQSIGWVKTASRSSLVSHAVLLMPLRAKKCMSWFSSISRKTSVKADLTIYGQVLVNSG